MREARLIYNPSAGRFPARRFIQRAVQVLEEEDWEVDIVETVPGQKVQDLAEIAASDGCETVLVAGGDGTVGQVASVLAGTDTVLGVLPAGTANVWAQELGLPHIDWGHWFALEQAAKKLANGSVRDVDLGVSNGRGFLLWAGFGLDGQIVNSIEPRQRWEKAFPIIRYATQTIWTSLDWEGVDLRVEADGNVWQDRFLVAVASNIRSYAGGMMEMAPQAKVDDGLLDFWLIGGKNIMDGIVRLAQILTGRHTEAEGVVSFRAEKATFAGESPLTMQYDGEPAEQDSPVEISIRNQALKVLVPEGGVEDLFTSSNSGEHD